jgi:tetratricopeptide (TPR) repeat protein
VEVVRDALFVPLEKKPDGIHGGLFDADGAPVDAAVVRRAGRPIFGHIQPDKLRKVRATLETPTLYLGAANAHFGHFLLESLARAWAWQAPDLPDTALLHRLGGRDVAETPHARLLLGALGVGARSCVTPSRPTRLGEVHVARPAIGLYEFAYAQHRATFLELGARVGLTDTAETEQPLYLSRAALSDSSRRAVGERAFEQALQASGFRIFRPEQHDLATQLRVVHAHRYIFGFWGSAFRLAYFTPRHKLTCYFGAEFPKASFLLDRTITGADTWFVRAATSCRLDGRKRQFFDLFAMDLGATLDVLRDQGFVRSDAPRPAEPSVQDLAREAGYADAALRPTQPGAAATATDVPPQFDTISARAAIEAGRLTATAERQLARQEAPAQDTLERLAACTDSWRAQRVVARARLLAGDASGGRSALERAHLLNPESGAVALELAAAQPDARALQTLTRALADAPGDRDLRAALVEQYLRVGDSEAAVAAQAEGARRDPDPTAGLLALARLHARLGSPERELTALRDAAAADPEAVETLRRLVPALLAADAPEETRDPRETLRLLRPAEPEPLRWLAEATRRTGRWRSFFSVRTEMLARKLRYALGVPVS